MRTKILLFISVLIFSQLNNVLHAQSANINFQKADSFYFASDWSNARSLYEKLLKDTSHDAMHLNRLGYVNYNLGNNKAAKIYYQRALMSSPNAPVKVSVLSRMARINSLENKTDDAFVNLDSAINAGYVNLTELDTLKDFNNMRSDNRFKKMRDKMYSIVNPCMVNPQAREFDFWIGEWNVYPTGATNIVGNSVIQMLDGGCGILENWTSPLSSGKSLNFVDPLTNKWKQVWVGYAGGIQEFINGEYKDSTMHFTFETKDAQGHKLIGRFIFYNQGASQVRQFNETSADDGKTWMTVYDFTYIRKNN